MTQEYTIKIIVRTDKEQVLNSVKREILFMFEHQFGV